MNRIYSIRSLALAIAFAGLSLAGGAGCVAEATDDDVLTGDLSARRAHYVSTPGSDDETPAMREHSFDTRAPSVHPNAGTNLGPRPEPWMSDGDPNGPRPEPWAPEGSSGGTPPPSGGTPSSSGGTPAGGSTSSSGGTPGNPNGK